MITTITGRGVLFICLCLSSFFLNSCTRPEDNAIFVPEEKPPVTAPEPSGPRVHTITIGEMKFHPEELKVNKGDTVVWENKDLVAHCITEVSKAWTSSKIEGGASWKMVINSGADYFCALHMVMKGKITIR